MVLIPIKAEHPELTLPQQKQGPDTDSNDYYGIQCGNEQIKVSGFLNQLVSMKYSYFNFNQQVFCKNIGRKDVKLNVVFKVFYLLIECLYGSLALT